MLRWIAGSTFASDGENASSDAWRFHGGAFGVWQCHAQWQLTLGALATGREDLPVLPAAGAIWLPTDRVRVELMMPRPRISLLVVERDGRQQWCYAGGGLGGGTWAVEQPDHTSDLLTYREWQLTLGWESKPAAPGAGPAAPGSSLSAELGYVLGRTFEFDGSTPDREPDNSLLLRANLKF